MKLIVAVIRPVALRDVVMALDDLGIGGMTVTEVEGYGRQRGHTQVFPGAEYTIYFVPKFRLEMLVNDEAADAVMKTIARTVATGAIGDGKIWTSPVESITRIRTQETGRDAI